MDVRFADERLGRLESDPAFIGGFGQDVVRGFRKVMQVIRAAVDERDFYAMKSLHFEKLRGNRSHQHSMRLNRQWRLVIELERNPSGKAVVVISVEDYH